MIKRAYLSSLFEYNGLTLWNQRLFIPNLNARFMFIHELWSDKFLKLETVPEKSQKSLPKKQQLGEF